MTNLTKVSHQSNRSLAAVRSLHVCMYGAGSMAEAIVRGMISKELLAPDHISMLNRSNEERLSELNKHYGVQTRLHGKSNEQLLQEADIIFLAMKPKDAAEALASLKSIVSPHQLIISVIAGLSISLMEQLLGGEMPIVRAMPNTSSTIGLGATGISFSSSVTEEQRFAALSIFESFGTASVVEEALQPAVTAISGSGPAYFYYFMEAMVKAGMELGLTKEAAHDLVVQTALGAAHMVRTTGEEPAELRRKVTSPNGSTQAAIQKMAEGELPETVRKAIMRCAERSMEMGEEIEMSMK